MILVNQGELPVASTFVHHIDTCLDCRACETACPSGVEYGKLVEHARARIEHEYSRPLLTRVARNFFFRRILPFPTRISAIARLLRIYQRTGLQALARNSGLLHALGLAEKEQLLPAIDRTFFFDQLGHTFPAQGPRRARVAFFAGCIANVTFSKLNAATVRVLTANGCEVVVPDQQRCCGALPAHEGIRETARELARNNLEAFSRANVDAIVTNAAGCGSTLKEYHHLFSPDEPEHISAIAFAKKIRDVTEFLSDLGLSAPLTPLPLSVTYQDSCHLLHGQKIRQAPRKLLQAIPGLELIEFPFPKFASVQRAYIT
jgi:glycolate oxidase iron-sulfur subunit